MFARDRAVTISVLANDTDPDGDALRLVAVTRAAHGAAAINSDGTLTYTPGSGSHRADTFMYVVTDDKGGQTGARVSVTPSMNRPPVAAPDTAMTPRNTSVTVDVLANDTDPDGDEVTLVSASQPKHGSVDINSNGTLTYKPNPNSEGVDAFVYTVTDGNGAQAVGTVNVVFRNMPPRQGMT